MTSTKRTLPSQHRTSASKPVPPDWQTNAFAALKGFPSAYLSGNTRLADF